MKKKVLFIILPLLILLAGLFGGGYYVYDNILNIDTIYQGVNIENMSLEGMTKDEALNFIKREKEEDLKKKMELNFKDINYEITLPQLGFSYDFNKAIDRAYNLGREGNYLDRFKKIQSLKKNEENIVLESSYDLSKVDEMVEKIAEDLYVEKIEAKFDFNNGNFKISDEKIGRFVDKDKLASLINNNIEKLNPIDIPVEQIQPLYTKEFFSGINGVIGEYSTSFKGSGVGRIENIKLSAKALSHKLLLPGEQLSYNNTTGPRQMQFGYQEAPVIIAGDLTPGIGGGVCQTSTTLYNALLQADMKILERSPHSISPAYVPRGQDAAVATGYLDLVFRNDFDFPVYTYSKVVGDRLYFYIYGDTRKKNYSIKIEPEQIEKIDYNVKEILDETLPPGSRQLVQEGRTGYKVVTYKSIIKDGKIISRNKITTDYYRERDYIYKIGPKPVGAIEEIEAEEAEEAITLEPESMDPIENP